MLIGLPDFSCFTKFSHFNVWNQSQLLLSKNDIQQLLPYIFKRQPQTAYQLSLLLQAALVQINEGLYFRSRRLATRFESNATNIAKVLVKALFNLIIKFNIQENQVLNNSQDHISSVFSFKIHCQNNKNAFSRRIYHHVSCSQLFGFFPLRLCRRQPRNRQIHRQVRWKRHRITGVVGKERNIGFVGFLGNAESKWCR